MTLKQKFRTSMKKVNGDLLTPISIFLRLQGKRKFLLESSTKNEGNGRYSFIGVDPRKTYSGNDTHLQDFSHLTNKHYHYEGELISLLKQVMPRVTSQTEYPLTGGGIGYIHALPATLQSTVPTLQFHVYDTLIIFDHLTDEIAVFHTNIEAEQVEPNIDQLIDELFTDSTLGDTYYTLHSLQQESQKLATAQFSGDVFALYRNLRVQEAAAYMYYIEFDECTVIGTSPKSFLQIRDGVLSTTNEEANLDTLCQTNSIKKQNALQTGLLSPAFHAIDAVKQLIPQDGLIGYIGFNGQVDFTTPVKTLTIIDDKAYIQTTNDASDLTFHALMKG
ncbi:metal ABC transporter ATP-binding protein [Solibacillus sp. R5-41]|uniref:chorismate-binding protein n=1 Tax=Solibacillus sp. R5-41 TaxID=2048654 RepID=UPI000C12697C|nr:chorismate-binding protein [Solibacillus sp. R5-41]ATP38905.1 metal ABC transporter ATP-binding protein [Solibacillus sp. R5-41]